MNTPPLFDFDARNLSFPGTGLALVTAELIRVLAACPEARGMRVFVDAANLRHRAEYLLEEVAVAWAPVPHRPRHPDYVDRWGWGREVLRAQRNTPRPLFIPYLYNYGRLRENLVLVPDLLYRLVPDYGGPTGRPWWDRRGRLPLRPLVRGWEERRAARARRVLVYSDFVGEHVREALGVAPERLRKIPLAPPTQLARALAQPGSGPPVVAGRFALYCGGYAVRKNISLLLRACHRAAAAEPSFRCVFAGLDATRLAEYSREAEGAASTAVVPLAKVDNASLAALYQACEFVVYPSRAEGFGLPVIEAAAAAKPCLCADNTSLREVQPEPRLRLPTDDDAAWAAALVERWRDPEGTRKLGLAARDRAARYTWAEAARIILAAAS